MAALSVVLSFHATYGGAAARLASFSGATQDESILNRPVLWKAALHMIAEHPLTGFGFGSFYLTYPSHRPVADRWSAGQWAHNDPLQFAVEMGILAPLLLYAFLFSLLPRTRRALKNTNDEQQAAIAGPLLGFLAMIPACPC